MKTVERHEFPYTPTDQMFKGSGDALVLEGGRAYEQDVAARRFPRLRAARAMVLIIAADAVARQVYGELFAMRGWDVVSAAGAREGLKLARDRRVTVAVLSLPTGAAQLRDKLHALRPFLRVHTTGMMPLPFDVMTPSTRQQLH